MIDVRNVTLEAVIAAGHAPASYSGWADQSLGHLYFLIEQTQATLPDGSTERACLGDALKAIELADVYVEKRLGETA